MPLSDNIYQDIQWLANLFQYRWNFLFCKEHYKGSVTSYLKTHHPNLGYYTPIDFSIIHSDFEYVFHRKRHNTGTYSVDCKGLFVYQKPNQLYQCVNEPYPYFITLSNEDKIVVEEIKGDWVKFTRHLCKFTNAQPSDYESTEVSQVWLPLKYTNIPANYHPDFNWQEFEQYHEHWTLEQRQLVQENLELQDRVVFWTNFYTQQDLRQVKPPKLEAKNSPYAQFIEQNHLTTEDRLLLILTLVNQVQPSFLLPLIESSQTYPDLGGRSSKGFKGFIPTGETFLFLLAGRNLFLRNELIQFLMQQSVLVKQGFVSLTSVLPEEPLMSGALAFHPQKASTLLLNLPLVHSSVVNLQILD